MDSLWITSGLYELSSSLDCRLVILNWDEIEVVTTSGMVLRRATLRNLEMDLEAFLFEQKTGVPMARTQFAFKAIFSDLGIDPLNFTTKDKQKFFDFAETALGEWIETRATARGSAKTLDPVFAKELPKQMHAILKSAGNEMGIDALSAVFAVNTKRSLDTLDEIREQIRIFCKGSYSDTFKIGRGPAGKITRELDEKANETGKTAPVTTSSTKAGKLFYRFSSKLQTASGLTATQWDKMRKDPSVKHTTDDKGAGYALADIQKWKDANG